MDVMNTVHLSSSSCSPALCRSEHGPSVKCEGRQVSVSTTVSDVDWPAVMVPKSAALNPKHLLSLPMMITGFLPWAVGVSAIKQRGKKGT